MMARSISTLSILLAMAAFSFAVDTPKSVPHESVSHSNSEEKVTTLHQLTTKDSIKLLQQITDDIKFDFLEENSSNDTLQGRGNKKEDKMMQSMYMAMMMSKAFFSIVFMFVNQVFQLKNFGFSLLNAIINIGRFIIQYQQHLTNQQKSQIVKLQAQDWTVGTTGYGYGSNYQYYTPSSAYSSSPPAGAAAAERVTRMSSGSSGNSLHANNLAYSAYAPGNAPGRT